MTSTPVISLLKRSGNSSDRPSGTVVVNGELALSFGAADPGLYFEDSAGGIRKLGPPGYGTTAPNSSPAGLPGNSLGELWVDSNSSAYYLKVWTGSTWQKIYASFADTAEHANTANSCIIASGTISSFFADTAEHANTANSCIIASGTISSFADTALLASGAILASGVVTAVGKTVTAIVTSGLPVPSTYPSGSLVYQIQSSGTAPSGLYIRVLNGWAFT
jgi:hypothetical protein